MKIEFGTKVIKFLLKLEKNEKDKVFKKIKELGVNPFPLNVKKLKDEKNVYRIRVGNFRILYHVIQEDGVVLIFRVDKRSRVYR